MPDTPKKLGNNTASEAEEKGPEVGEGIAWIMQKRLLSLSFWMNILLLTAVCSLAGAIVYMLPLKTTETVFVWIKSAEENFVVMQKANGTLNYDPEKSNPALISDYLRIYVSHREKVDKATEQIRYQRVKAMSTKDVGDTFEEIITNKSVSAFQQPNLIRDIRIITDIPLARGIHQINFERTDSYDNKPGAKPQVTRWVATIRYKFSAQKTKYSRKYLNPLGLFVDQYNITQARGEE